MGLFSSIKKGLSKAWSGTKKAVKGIAKGIKKVAKGVVTSTPWGQKLWKEGGRLGKKVMAGIGKISSKLGPIGMMALSFVLAPVMGPMIGALWSGFGTAAAGMAASANAFVSTLGSIGSGIFAGGNFIGGTLGAMGNAITEGASNIMSGNFSGAIDAFATNMSNALTGKAGMASVNAGALQASAQAASDLALSGGPVDQIATLNQQSSTAFQNLNDMGQVGADKLASMDLDVLAKASPEAAQFQANLQSAQANSPVAQWTPDAVNINKPYIDPATGQPAMSMSEVPNFSDSLQMSTQAANNAGITNSGMINNGVNQFMNPNPAPPMSAMDKIKTGTKAVQSLLGGGGDSSGGYQPYVPKAITSQQIGAASGAKGTGSSGFSLLGGVQGLEQSVRNSQQMMFG